MSDTHWQPTPDEVRAAVEEAYTVEGQRIWWWNWERCTPEHRAMLDRLICTEPGGT